MKKMTTLELMCCAIALIFTAASAHATLTTYEADITFEKMGAYQKIDVKEPINSEDAPTGALILEKTWGNNPNWSDGTKLGFCVEIDQNASTSSKRYTEIPIEYVYDSETSDALSELWGRYYNAAWAVNNSTNNVEAAAFQMALWEIIYDGPDNFDFSNGNFESEADTTTNNLASAWLTSLDGTGSQATNLKVLQNNYAQDFLVQLSGTVPEPMTILLLLSAVPYVFSRRKHAN